MALVELPAPCEVNSMLVMALSCAESSIFDSPKSASSQVNKKFNTKKNEITTQEVKSGSKKQKCREKKESSS